MFTEVDSDCEIGVESLDRERRRYREYHFLQCWDEDLRPSNSQMFHDQEELPGCHLATELSAPDSVGFRP